MNLKFENFESRFWKLDFAIEKKNLNFINLRFENLQFEIRNLETLILKL